MQSVVAGLIVREKRYLICQRSRHGAHPLEWEFPGGKVEAGESPEQALVRELREELAIEAEPGREVTRYQYAYPGKSPVLLMFFEVASYQGTPENVGVFEQLAWARPDEFAQYNFLAGDSALIQLLRKVDVD